MSPDGLVIVTASASFPGRFGWSAWQALQRGPAATDEAGAVHGPSLAEAGVPLSVLDRPTTEGVWLDEGGILAGQLAGRAGVQVIGAAGPAEPAGARLLDVVAVMDRLRSPGGCPWDARQSHESLLPYLVEEAYEVYTAIEDRDGEGLREELGDLLLQVVFHARLAQDDEAPFTIDDVAGDLVDKLVRRHPHVFAGASADDLEGSWEALKSAEKGRTSVTDGVPLTQPALSLAATLHTRAARLGAVLEPPGAGIGAELWQLVVRARAEGLDAEVELRATARALRDRLVAAERAVREDGGDPASVPAEQWAQLLAGQDGRHG